MTQGRLITYWPPLPGGGWGHPVYLTVPVFQGNLVAADPYVLYQEGGYICVKASAQRDPLKEPFAREILELSEFTNIRTLTKHKVAIIRETPSV